MAVEFKKFKKGLFFVVGLIFSTPSFSQSSNITMTIARPSTCTLQFSDMQVQNGSSQLSVSSTGSVSFPAEYVGLPLGNVSMTNTYCNSVCSSCTSASCKNGPYGRNLNQCLSKCSKQVFISQNPLISNDGTIPITCNPHPPHAVHKNKINTKKN